MPAAGRQYFLDLARGGLRMPIGADLLLHECADPGAVTLDGRRLGEVIAKAARRYRTPIAVPLMDLRLEKADLLRCLGVPEEDAEKFHFAAPPAVSDLERLCSCESAPFAARNQAHIDSIHYIAEHTDLCPVGMAIGPFSLATKLIGDPITPIALAGAGMTAADDESILLVERCLAAAELAVRRSVGAQAEAGARAVLICEPAANIVYLSPRQIEKGSDIFERFVIHPNLRLRETLAAAGADLIFHDCGELTTGMVEAFATRLHPVILSLGSSRALDRDARLVPADVVLFGNLPTKRFYSDADMPLDRVRELTVELVAAMRRSGHAHILGSECDVLHVPESSELIRRKVDLMLTCAA